MPAIIPPLPALRPRAAPDSLRRDRTPHYECEDLAQMMKLVVYVPGVEARGIEITTHGPDLIILARRMHPGRLNWLALHLEGAQRDYALRLRLGAGFDYRELRAELGDGILTIHLPKRQPAARRRVA